MKFEEIVFKNDQLVKPFTSHSIAVRQVGETFAFQPQNLNSGYAKCQQTTNLEFPDDGLPFDNNIVEPIVQ